MGLVMDEIFRVLHTIATQSSLYSNGYMQAMMYLSPTVVLGMLGVEPGKFLLEPLPRSCLSFAPVDGPVPR